MNKRLVVDLYDNNNPYRTEKVGTITYTEITDFSKFKRLREQYSCTNIVSDLINYIKKNKKEQLLIVEIDKFRLYGNKNNKESIISYMKDLINSYEDAIILMQISNESIIPLEGTYPELSEHELKLEVYDMMTQELEFEYIAGLDRYNNSIPIAIGTGIKSRKLVNEIL